MDDNYKAQYQAELDAGIDTAFAKFKADNPDAAHGHSDACLRRTFTLAFLAGLIWKDNRSIANLQLKIAKSKDREAEFLQAISAADQRLAEIRDQCDE